VRAVIRRFDLCLSRALKIFRFTDAEDCLLRLQITTARNQVHLPRHCVQAGETVLAIHLWNEHVPPLARGGSDLAWAARTGRLFLQSLHAAGKYVCGHPELAGLPAVCGATAVFSPFQRSGGSELMRRLGFTVLPYRGPLGRFGEFWENFYSWWIIWAYNPAGLRRRRFGDLRRAEIWMPMDEFISRYGEPRTGPPTPEAVRLRRPNQSAKGLHLRAQGRAWRRVRKSAGGVRH
jgi:hypothetical protein